MWKNIDIQMYNIMQNIFTYPQPIKTILITDIKLFITTI